MENKSNIILNGLSIAVIGLMSSSNLSANNPIVEYKFFGGVNETYEDGTGTDANLSGTAWTQGAGLTQSGVSGSSGNFFVRTNGTTATDFTGAVSANQYASFTITVASGYEMSLSSFEYDFGYTSGTFSSTTYIQTDLTIGSGGSTTSLGSVNLNGTADLSGPNRLFYNQSQVNGTYAIQDNSVDLSASQFQNIAAGDVEFRIYFSDNVDISSIIYRLDNIELYGTVVAVPEVGTFALIGGLFALGHVVMRRRV